MNNPYEHYTGKIICYKCKREIATFNTTYPVLSKGAPRISYFHHNSFGKMKIYCNLCAKLIDICGDLESELPPEYLAEAGLSQEEI